jgi:hypothetical protein
VRVSSTAGLLDNAYNQEGRSDAEVERRVGDSSLENSKVLDICVSRGSAFERFVCRNADSMHEDHGVGVVEKGHNWGKEIQFLVLRFSCKVGVEALESEKGAGRCFSGLFGRKCIVCG